MGWVMKYCRPGHKLRTYPSPPLLRSWFSLSVTVSAGSGLWHDMVVPRSEKNRAQRMLVWGRTEEKEKSRGREKEGKKKGKLDLGRAACRLTGWNCISGGRSVSVQLAVALHISAVQGYLYGLDTRWYTVYWRLVTFANAHPSTATICFEPLPRLGLGTGSGGDKNAQKRPIGEPLQTCLLNPSSRLPPNQRALAAATSLCSAPAPQANSAIRRGVRSDSDPGRPTTTRKKSRRGGERDRA